MNMQLKSRVLLIIIFLLALAPMLLAFWFAQNPEYLGKPTAHGQLLTPAHPIERTQLIGADAFAREHITQLHGRWVLLHLVRGDTCGPTCLESLHKSKQLRLMMNKDLSRIRRAALLIDRNTQPHNWPEDPLVLKLLAAPELKAQLAKLPIPQQADSLVVLDPLTNLIMWYEEDFDPYQVRDDLKKLLSVSQIG
ncbi:MAG: hypothetical protein RQ715_07435 [Methylococcales bacterium]|nr:hypothetical protein [Methylococcales bacterium]